MDKDDNGTISREEMNFFIRVSRGSEPMPEKPTPEPEAPIEELKEDLVEAIQEAVAEADETPAVPPTPEEITALIWAEYDKDASGSLSKGETRKFVKDLLGRLGEEPKITEEEFDELFRDIDDDSNGTLSKDEISLFIKQVKGEEPLPPKKVIAPPVEDEPAGASAPEQPPAEDAA
jgi:Ca2+-binding EF-hand superfamily protein